MGRYDDAPLPYTSATPPSAPGRSVSLSRQRTTGGTVKRAKTLTRPERHIAPIPLLNPTAQIGGGPVVATADTVDWWRVTSWIVTFWALPPILSAAGMKDKNTRQAWREKFTLVFIALVMGGFVGFATLGLQSALCPGGSNNRAFQRLGSADSTLSISGYSYNISDDSPTPLKVSWFDLAKDVPGQDITPIFTRTANDYPSCGNSQLAYAKMPYCNTNAGTGNQSTCAVPEGLKDGPSAYKMKKTQYMEGYAWAQVAELDHFMVIDGFVLNMGPYMQGNPTAISGDNVDLAIRTVLASSRRGSGKDATLTFYSSQVLKDAIPCLTSRYLAGRIDKVTPGCFVANLFLYASLLVILSVVLIRFVMALIFNWFISYRLVRPPNTHRTGISPSVMPEGANVSVHNKTGQAPWAGGASQPRNKLQKPNPNAPNMTPPAPVMSLDRIGAELFTVCLVTCYSEGEEGIRNTLESIAGTSFPDSRKLLWIVCDGMITGAGERMSTPDICVSMLDADLRFGNPQPMGYTAIGAGTKADNRAMVYAGHFCAKNGNRTPTVIIVKCGMPSEAGDKKPGNRGKRDSQMILMNFFSRVTYNDRMSPLDYDIFRKVHTLMGVTPDFFEVCLMVDADTKVYPDSLTYLVHAMANDNMVMGVCGETRIANKRQSWVTAIQVYEYFIAHHHIKAFESVFGGVTCLPGCFSMYRIKARKDDDDDWVPILVKPEIIREYSQSDVQTLHQKNLLLLGEDRFLSTIMLRTFPNRKNIFLPQAKCRTIAPDEFKVLLSQRRRWINSTVHNLMELVLVRNLCGTFCFSMQFVVFMDLFGTIVLPVAICLTLALVINSIITPPKSFSEAIPLCLLAAVLGLPAFLILISTRKPIYCVWMIAYLFALPIWNFVLPVYSFWHFDDFSWGETRKVEGEVVDKTGHGAADKGELEPTAAIPLRRWEDWERSRLKKIRREEKRRRQLERQHGRAFYNDGEVDDHGMLMAPDRAFARGDGDSDASSILSSEEDMWGGEVGGYDEHHPSYPPPPAALGPEQHPMPGKTLGVDEMANILDKGFDERPPPQAAWRAERNANSPLHRTLQPGAFDPSAPNGYSTVPQSPYDSSPNGRRYSPQSPLAASPPEGYAGAWGNGPTGSVAQTTAYERAGPQGHARMRSGGGGGAHNTSDENVYGPLGPLDDKQYANNGADNWRRA